MSSYYRNLEVWKRSYELNKKLFLELKKFPKEEQYVLTDQIRRAGLSISANIAEGSGRGSNPDYVRFLHMAKGSAMEVETHLLFAKDFGYIDESSWGDLQGDIDSILKMLYGLIKNL